MKYRLTIIIILLITLPLAVLGWQSFRILDNEQNLQQAQFIQLTTLRQQQTSLIIKHYFEQQATYWRKQISSWPLTSRHFDQSIQDSPKINHIFMIKKQRHYPEVNKTHSQRTQAFILRMKSIWEDPQRLFSNDQQQTPEKAPVIQSRLSKRPPKVGIDSTHSGWTMWHWESRIIIIYWYQFPNGDIVGLELNSSLLMADIITLLPDSDNSDEQRHYAQRLVNANGQIAYEWGGLKISNTAAVHSTLLPYPLSTWQLEYYAQPNHSKTLSLISLLLLLGIFSLILSAMGYYLFREHNREVRLAKQRVSFVGQVSHELKTPLTNIRLYAEMLEDSLDEDPKSQQYSQIIVNESQRLTRLINNVLSFSRQAKAHVHTINADDEIRQTAQYFIPSFKRHGLEINFQLNAHRMIKADSDSLDQIVNNLLSNVEKYAVEGKQVDITTQITTNAQQQDYFILRIRDYGKGIASHAQKHIFNAFYRANDDITEGVSGTGIGLTIARQQAEKMSASLNLIPVEQGACFEFKLPLS